MSQPSIPVVSEEVLDNLVIHIWVICKGWRRREVSFTGIVEYNYIGITYQSHFLFIIY